MIIAGNSMKTFGLLVLRVLTNLFTCLIVYATALQLVSPFTGPLHVGDYFWPLYAALPTGVLAGSAATALLKRYLMPDEPVNFPVTLFEVSPGIFLIVFLDGLFGAAANPMVLLAVHLAVIIVSVLLAYLIAAKGASARRTA